MWEDKKVVILFGRDVTELIKFEKENMENSYKSSLLITVSHELRTPTNAMLAMSEILLDSKELSAENQERVTIITSFCSYLLCLINDLLDYAQIMAGCLKTVKVSFNLPKLLKECLSIFDIELNRANICSEIFYFNLIPDEIITDPYRLKQIIINLLSNAKKFTQYGSIKLSISYNAPMLTISCKDTGTGIEESKISTLFKTFGKIENILLNPLGVGLGLYISNMIIHELGGNGLRVSSILGEGSVFTFQIPIGVSSDLSPECEIADENSNISLPNSITTKLLEKYKILIVDDTYFNILAYFQIFKGEGLLCEHAMNGSDAIEKIKIMSFNCIIMDCEMNNISGWETTKVLKVLEANKEIKRLPPIIGTSAYDSDSVREECLSSGMDDFLAKPCPKKDTIEKIMHWIQTSKYN